MAVIDAVSRLFNKEKPKNPEEAEETPADDPAAGQEQTSATPEVKDVEISRSKYPEAAKHIEDAQEAGPPSELTVDREGTDARRAESQGGHEKVPGFDLDEYPPAVTEEGGAGASVRPISIKDNRGAGAALGNQIRNVPNGGKIRIIVVP